MTPELKAFRDSFPSVYGQEPAKAMEAFMKAYSIFKETLGENHPHVATCCNNIGNVLGNLKLALYYYAKALGINMDWYGDNHTKVATNSYNIATVYDDLDEPEKALEIYTEQLGDDHPDTLEVRDLIEEIKSSTE